MKKNVEKMFQETANSFKNFATDKSIIESTYQASNLFAKALKNGNKVLICGNGGSLTDAMHFAEEMTGNFRKKRRALPAIALSDSSHITCVGNDFGFDEIFARGVEAFGKKGDILIAISTSGNSKNVIKAVKKAQELKMKTIALSANGGGQLKNICTKEILVIASSTDCIQALHITVLHTIIEIVERILFPENY